MRISPCNQARDSSCSFAGPNKQIFMVGGRSKEGLLNDIEKYTIENDQWEQVPQIILRNPVNLHSCVYDPHSNELVVFGGVDQKNVPFDEGCRINFQTYQGRIIDQAFQGAILNESKLIDGTIYALKFEFQGETRRLWIYDLEADQQRML